MRTGPQVRSGIRGRFRKGQNLTIKVIIFVYEFFFLRRISRPAKVKVNPDISRKLHLVPLLLPGKARNFARRSHKPRPFISAKEIRNPLSSAPYRPEKPKIFNFTHLTWSDFYKIWDTSKEPRDLSATS